MKNSNKILVIAVVLLLLVNIGMLIFMLQGKGKGHPRRAGGRGEVVKEMVKELNMSSEQEANYKKLKEEHFKNIRPVFDSIRSLKQSMFALVRNDNANDSLIANFSSRIAEQQAIADKTTINHFRTVRAMFSGEQQAKFDTFMQRMMQKKRAENKKDAKNKE